MSGSKGRTGHKPIKHKERRLKLIEWFGDRCNKCYLTYPHYVYEFHHRIPKDKEFSLGGKDLNRKWEKVVIEASKCILVCSNCHKRIHYNMEKEND